MKQHYQGDGRSSIISPGMLAMSRALNPELEHHQGDMRTVRLGRQFDAVFVHDADLLHDDRIRSAASHSRPRSCTASRAASRCSAPTTSRENFEPATDHGGEDDGTRGMRWRRMADGIPIPSDTTYLVDYAYLLREARWLGAASSTIGTSKALFPRADWLRLLRETRIRARRSLPLELSDFETRTHEVFVCVRHRIRESG